MLPEAFVTFVFMGLRHAKVYTSVLKTAVQKLIEKKAMLNDRVLYFV